MRMTARSSLVLQGDVCIAGKVEIDGALVIKAAPGAKVVVGDLTVSNAGWSLMAATGASDDEFVRMRGYQVLRQGTDQHIFSSPGEYKVP